MEHRQHPPWIIGQTTETVTPHVLAHAALWIEVEVPQWRARRRAHLHLVAADNGTPKLFNLARWPLRMAPHGTPDLGADERRQWCERVGEWLAMNPVRLHRQPELAMVSEIAEGSQDFVHRLRAAMGPEVRRRLEALEVERPRRWWQRRRPTEERERTREQLVTSVARLAAGIEVLELDAEAAVRRLETGVLLAGDDVLAALIPSG